MKRTQVTSSYNIVRGCVGLSLVVTIISLFSGQQALAATSFEYRYLSGTPLECCDDFDTSNEAADLTGAAFGNGNLNNGLIGFDIYADLDVNGANGEYRNGNTFAYQAEGTPGAGTEFNGTYTSSQAFDLRIDFGSVQTNLGTLRIDYNTNPAATFGKPGDITITDDNNTVTVLSASLPAESDGAGGRGVYQFVVADISSLSGQFLTVNIPFTNQFLGVNELTFEAVPEPSSLSLLSLGLASLWIARGRRRGRRNPSADGQILEAASH